jgi:hypothetical protein
MAVISISNLPLDFGLLSDGCAVLGCDAVIVTLVDDDARPSSI